MKMELIRLKGELSHQSISVIEKGIGVGHFKKVIPPEAKSQQRTATVNKELGNKTNHTNYQAPLRSQFVATDKLKQKRASFQQPSARHRLKVMIYDMVFILATLIVGTLSLNIVIGSEEIIGTVKGIYMPFLPWKTPEATYFFVAILSLYILYRLIFKLFLGRTLGESLVHKEVKAKNRVARR